MQTDNTHLTPRSEFLLNMAEAIIASGELLPINLHAELVEEGIDVEGLIQQYADNYHDNCEE